MKKTGSTTGQDRAWVDEISLPPHEIVVGTGTPDATAFRIAYIAQPHDRNCPAER